MSDVPTLFFYKELLSNPIWLPNGRQAPWEPVGDDAGVIATNDANIIFHLGNLADRHVGGVIKIDEPRYVEAKKNSNGSVLQRPLERSGIGGMSVDPSLLRTAPLEPVVVVPVVAAGDSSHSVAPVNEPPKPVRVGRAKVKSAAAV